MAGDNEDYRTSAIIGGGLTVCGIPPRKRLVTLDKHLCWNCEDNGQDVSRVVRMFSGSGWYEDHLICLDCGEDVSSGYRPFAPAWREKNKRKAQGWIDEHGLLDYDEFHERTMEIIREEMDWDE